jgi:hypothetical protein
LKRYPAFMVFGFITLLLATAAAFSSAPVPRANPCGLGPASQHPVSAANEINPGLVIRNAFSLATSLSRIDSSSPNGITPQSVVPATLESHGLGIADILAFSVCEIGFHSLLRAPPAPLLN